MTPEQIAAIAAAVVVILGGIGAFVVRILRQANQPPVQSSDTLQRLATLEVKVNTLWEIYVTDTMREARRQGMTERNSPEDFSRKAKELLPDELRESIYQALREKAHHLEPMDLAVEVMYQFKRELKAIAQENDLSPSVFLGTIAILAENVRERENVRHHR